MAQKLGNILYIEEKTVVEKLDLKLLVTELEKAFQEFSRRAVEQPVRLTIPVAEHNGLLLAMPAYSSKLNTLATKIISIYRDNEQKYGIPRLQGHVFYFDAQKGTLKALVEANALSALRTAAATAAATKHLSEESVSTLAIIGCGAEGRSHIKLLKLVREFKEIRLWNRTRARAEKLAEEFGCVVCDTVEETVKDADVIVTATLASEPVLFGKWVKTGALVNIIGAPRPDWREVDDDLMKTSQVFADSKDAAMEESGDVIHSKVEVVGEVGDVINQVIKPDFSRTRIFKSLGMAVEDGVAAKLVVDAVAGND